MDTKKTKYQNTGVWLVVALLVILLIITWVLLAGMLGGHATQGETISLTPQESKKTLYQTLYQPVKAVSGAETEDQQVQWESSTDINLFEAVYTNTEGKETVKSEIGDKVIAPGTTNQYTFSIRNTGNTVLEYTISLENTFDLDNEEIPMEFRLRRGDEWLAGDENTWCTLAEINAFSGSAALNPSKIDQYQLEWQWPYEGEDVKDNMLGQLSLKANADFHMTIITTAEAAADAAAVDADGNLLYEQTINGKEILLIVADILIAAALFLVFLWRRKIYVTGFAPAAEQRIFCDRKNSQLGENGRFAFEKMPVGNHHFVLDGKTLDWKLVRKRDLNGIRFQETEIWIGRQVRAVELYLEENEGNLVFDPERWAAIDKKNNVYTPSGMKKPDKNGTNTTPGGLHADRQKKYSFRR